MNKRLSLPRRIVAIIVFCLFSIIIGIIFTIPVLMTDWLDYVSGGRFTKNLSDIWNGDR